MFFSDITSIFIQRMCQHFYWLLTFCL